MVRAWLLLCITCLSLAQDSYFSISVNSAVPVVALNRIAYTQPENYKGVEHLEIYYPVYQHFTIFLIKTVAYRDMCLFFLRNAEVYSYVVEESLQHEYTSTLWYKDRMDQKELPLDHSAFHQIGLGSGVRIFVVDSGVNGDHMEFNGRVTHAWRVPGQPDSPCGIHGTWVASLAAGETTGIAPNAEIISIRVARDEIGCAFYTSDAIAGLASIINFVQSTTTTMGNISQPGVINLSWIGAGNSIIDTLVTVLYDMGFVVVAAAGNSGSSLEPCAYSPARAGKAITVGATDRNDKRAGFSNYGSCVDIFAPGVDLTGASATMNTGYIVDSGTSGSAPLVAGLAAVIYSREDYTSAEQVTDLLRVIAAYDVIVDLDNQSPNRLINFYPLVQLAVLQDTLLDVTTDAGNRIVNVF